MITRGEVYGVRGYYERGSVSNIHCRQARLRLEDGRHDTE